MPSVTISYSPQKKAIEQTTLRMTVPPDKSILHRALIISALSESTITFPLIDRVGEDIVTTINALRQLGVRIEHSDFGITVIGVGKRGLQASANPIDCRNSGTTARLLMGVLSAQNFSSTLIGDESLSRRPMGRLAELLNTELGADISTTEGLLPVKINGRELHSANVMLPVASAQIKSSLLLAVFCSGVFLTLTEPYQSRDHTEIMLRACGVDIQSNNTTVFLPAGRELQLPKQFQWEIPGDISSASFLMVAGAISNTDLIIENVGINPSRTAAIETLSDSGVPIFINEARQHFGENIGNVQVSASNSQAYKSFFFSHSAIPNIQDEIPALSVFAAFAKGTSSFAGATELRVKESDRLKALYNNLSVSGVQVTESPDGLQITGSEKNLAGDITVNNFNDHRIAMAMSVAALRSEGRVIIPDSDVVSVSYPSFFDRLRQIADVSGHDISIA